MVFSSDIFNKKLCRNRNKDKSAGRSVWNSDSYW